LIGIAVTRNEIARIGVDSNFAMDQSLAVVCDHQLMLWNIYVTGVVFNDVVALRLRIEKTVERDEKLKIDDAQPNLSLR
jgi:hypothetical protein